jgi:WD40 repeat protein
LKKYSHRSLYLDEVIDVKIIKPEAKFALLCSNSETLKLLNLETGEVELYKGHTDIILCLDICGEFCVTGAKDNTIRLWKYDVNKGFEKKIKCLAEFLGHSQNVTSV